MSEQNNETSQQLKRLAIDLHNIALSMRVQYRFLSFLVFVEVLCLVIIPGFIVFENRILQELDSAILAIFILLIVDVVALIIYVRLRRRGSSFRISYQEGRGILQTMADKAEWTRYKKRLIYRGNDEKTSYAVDDFFSVSEKTWSPCRSERRYYSLLVLMFPLYVLSSFFAFILKAIFGF